MSTPVFRPGDASAVIAFVVNGSTHMLVIPLPVFVQPVVVTVAPPGPELKLNWL